MAQQPRGFAQLPRELLVKILDEMDNETILPCTELSPFLNEAGVETLFRRLNIPDPRTYCGLEVYVPERLSPGTTTNALAALLGSRQNYASIRQLHVTIHPPPGLHVMIHAAPMRRAARSEQSPRDPLKDRMASAFGPLLQFLTRVGRLEEVTLNVWDWTHWPDGLSTLLEDLVHLIMQKRCHTLQVRCAHEPTVLPWTIASPSSSRISRLFSSLTCGTFGRSSAQLVRQKSHSHLTALNADMLFFHPTGVQWMADLFSKCLTDLTLSFHYTASSGLYFTDKGLAVLFRGFSRLRSLTVLDANEDVIRGITPGLGLFTALRDLTLDMGGHDASSTTPLQEVAARAFWAPSALERLAISPQLIDYVLPGTVAASALKEVKLLYSKADTTGGYIPSISGGIASARRYFAGRSAAISIAVRLSTLVAVRVPFHRILTLTTQSATQDPSEFSAVDTLHIQCNMLGELESEESKQSCIGLTKMFSEVKTVMVRGPTDFRQTQRRPGTPAGVGNKVLARLIFSKCRRLTSLCIGAEEYLRS